MAITITGPQYITAPGSYSYSVSLDSGATIQSVDVYARTEAVRNEGRNITNVQTLSNNSILIQLAGNGFGEAYQIKVTERNSDESLSSETYNFFYSNVTTDPIVVNNNCAGTYMCSESTSSSPIRFLCTPGESITYKVRSADTVSLSSANTLQLNNVQISSETRYGVTEYTITGIVDSSTPVSTPGTTDNLTFNITIGNKTFYSTYTCLAPDYAFGTRFIYSQHETTDSYKGERQVHNTTVYVDDESSSIVYGHKPVGGSWHYSNSAPVYVGTTSYGFTLSPNSSSLSSGTIKLYSSSSTNCATFTCTKRPYAVARYGREGFESWISKTYSFTDLVYGVSGGSLSDGRLRLLNSSTWASINANGELVVSANNSGDNRSLDLVFYDSSDTEKFITKHFTQTFAPNVVSEPATMTFNVTGGTTSYPITCTWNGCLYGFLSSDNWINVQDSTKKISVGVNTGSNSRQSTLVSKCYSGDPINSSWLHEVSDSVTLTQKGLSGTVVVTPETKEVNGASGSTTFAVSTSNMDTVEASIDSSTISGLTATLNQENTQLTVAYGANAGSTGLSATIRVSGTDINGDTQYDTVQLTQHPKGTITINPSTTEVGFTAGTATMALVLNNIDTSSVSVSSSSAWVTTNYDANTRQITITYADNTDNVRTATIIVNANDVWGASISSTATLTQMEVGDVTINCSPISRTLTATEQMCQFYVNATPGITLSYSYTGNLDVDTTRTEIDVDRQTGEGYFKVYTNDNETSQLKTGVFVVTATYGGTTYRSNEMTVYKQGVGGSIILTPSSVEIPAWSGSMDIDVNHTNIDVDDMSAIIVSSTINNLSATLNADKTKLTIAWDGSTNTSEQSARISVRGTDYWGYNKYTILEVTQVGVTPYIRLIPDVIDVPAKAGSVVLNVEYWGVDGNYYCNDVGTMSGSITVDRTNNTIRYTYNANTRRTPRRGELLTIDTITSTQESISTVGIINQAPGVIDSIKPVWNPDQINIMTENSFMEYHIDIADNIVYAGKIYKQPDSDVISFNIGDVASNYLHNGLAFSDGLNLIPDYVKDFKIVTNEATEYNQTIYNSWAYEDTDYWLSEPIDYRISCKQWLPVSFISTNYREINVNNQAYYANRVNKGWTVMQNLRNYNVSNDILVYGADGTTRSYKIADGDYVLYYANAFGGWDSLLCNATSKKTDNIESLNYRKKSYSRDEFSKIDYQKNITPTWTMNTGIIKSGDKMHHLLESTMVYLHKLETDEIIPVVVTNSTCDYLNYTNNGKRPCTYQITVEESNVRLRK